MKNFYEDLVENLFDGVYYVNLDRQITYWNKSAERITGFSREEVMGRRCSDNVLRHVDENGSQYCVQGCPLLAAISDGNFSERLLYLHHKEGHRLPIHVRATPYVGENGDIIGAVEVFSEAHSRLEMLQRIESLSREAYADGLTGTGNRRFAGMTLETKLIESANHQVPFGVLLVDVDLFKRVNDTYGHNAGDRVLTMVAQSLLGGVRPLDVVARWGGEEFLVILPNVNMEALTTVAERLRILVQESFLLLDSGEEIRVTISLGGSLASHGDTRESSVERADTQLYRSKQGGRNQFHLFAEIA